jgi:hypothetical protein
MLKFKLPFVSFFFYISFTLPGDKLNFVESSVCMCACSYVCVRARVCMAKKCEMVG